jgi:hypothetical protein
MALSQMAMLPHPSVKAHYPINSMAGEKGINCCKWKLLWCYRFVDFCGTFHPYPFSFIIHSIVFHSALAREFSKQTFFVVFCSTKLNFSKETLVV